MTEEHKPLLEYDKTSVEDSDVRIFIRLVVGGIIFTVILVLINSIFVPLGWSGTASYSDVFFAFTLGALIENSRRNDE